MSTKRTTKIDTTTERDRIAHDWRKLLDGVDTARAALADAQRNRNAILDNGAAPTPTRLAVLEAELAVKRAEAERDRVGHVLAAELHELDLDSVGDASAEAEAVDVRAIVRDVDNATAEAAELRRRADELDAYAAARIARAHGTRSAVASKREAAGLPPPLPLPTGECLVPERGAWLRAQRAVLEPLARAFPGAAPERHATAIAKLEAEIQRVRASLERARREAEAAEAKRAEIRAERERDERQRAEALRKQNQADAAEAARERAVEVELAAAYAAQVAQVAP